jgi:ribonuclease BN (tRNA processing enzyme)
LPPRRAENRYDRVFRQPRRDGYRVVTSKPDGTADRTIVLSGDTSLFDDMEKVYAGADILFHEAYSFDPKTSHGEQTTQPSKVC